MDVEKKELENSVHTEAIEPQVIQAIDVYPVGVQAADPNVENDAIRDDFIYLLCCAFSFKNIETFQKCFGARSECTLLCIENSSAAFKLVDDAKACFILQSGGAECVKPRKCYSEYWQCFCFECYASLPPIEGKFKQIHNKHYGIVNNFKPAGDATLCLPSYCCMYTSCNCRCATCWGCYDKSVLLCLENELIQLKPLCCESKKQNPDTLCILLKAHRTVVWPYTCFKFISQCFCCDCRGALPCDEEVPCIFGLCHCCTLCVDWRFLLSCCNTINQISDKSRAQRGLPPMKHHSYGAAPNNNNFNTSGATNAQYSQVATTAIATPEAVQYDGETGTEMQYKQAASSAPVDAQVVAVEESHEKSI